LTDSDSREIYEGNLIENYENEKIQAGLVQRGREKGKEYEDYEREKERESVLQELLDNYFTKLSK